MSTEKDAEKDNRAIETDERRGLNETTLFENAKNRYENNKPTQEETETQHDQASSPGNQ